jgi:hypothetical protein
MAVAASKVAGQFGEPIPAFVRTARDELQPRAVRFAIFAEWRPTTY